MRCPPIQPRGWFPEPRGSWAFPAPPREAPPSRAGAGPGRGPPTPCRLASQYQPGWFHREPSVLNSSSLGAFLPPRRSSHSIVRVTPNSGYLLERVIFKWFVKNKSYYFPSSWAMTVIPHSLAPLSLRPVSISSGSLPQVSLNHQRCLMKVECEQRSVILRFLLSPL